MTGIQTRTDYEDAIAALGICVSARIPVLLWGNPGEGKTAVVESAAAAGWHVETVILTHSEPSDFAGLPVLRGDGSVTLAPPAWARRLAEHAGPSIAFFDEFSTASPSLQAAALRPLTHYEVGALALPSTVSFVAAANPADVAAAGWDLAAPTASRFVHLDWGMPLDVFSEGLVTGAWPTIAVAPRPPAFERLLLAERVQVTGFLHARPSQLAVAPRTAADRSRAFPSPRTWDYASRLSAFAHAVDAPEAVRRILIAGCVGDAATHEFLQWSSANDLPDAESVLADPAAFSFRGLRPDRVHVVLQGVLGAVANDPSPERWTTAIDVCSRAAADVGIDSAVPVVRALMRPGTKPAGVVVPASISVFAPALALAGLLGGAG